MSHIRLRTRRTSRCRLPFGQGLCLPANLSSCAWACSMHCSPRRRQVAQMASSTIAMQTSNSLRVTLFALSASTSSRMRSSFLMMNSLHKRRWNSGSGFPTGRARMICWRKHLLLCARLLGAHLSFATMTYSSSEAWRSTKGNLLRWEQVRARRWLQHWRCTSTHCRAKVPSSLQSTTTWLDAMLRLWARSTPFLASLWAWCRPDRRLPIGKRRMHATSRMSPTPSWVSTTCATTLRLQSRRLCSRRRSTTVWSTRATLC
mmetsp:Transcript_10445/g.22175  ORF Transcript_10445/g.22175 Transcript_10445/m.22175 type:complete len:260 (+) Transcript_10445:111-890(+)